MSSRAPSRRRFGRAIRAVASGEAIFGPGIAQRVLRFFANPAQAADPFPELTAREREILDLLAAAMPNSMIATRLGLSPKTVANHLSSIFTKLQVGDRAQAILRARDAGLGTRQDRPQSRAPPRNVFALVVEDVRQNPLGRGGFRACDQRRTQQPLSRSGWNPSLVLQRQY
jgi:DNA-binding CsgD family transcriptional regulator